MRFIPGLIVSGIFFVIPIAIGMSLVEGCKKDEYIPVNDAFYKTYFGVGELTGRDILKNGNGFMIAGFGHGTNVDEDFFLFNVDSMGNEISRRFVGTAGNDQCWSFVNSKDGGYIIAGWTDVNAAGISNDVLIVKTDADGNQLWSKIYGGAFNDISTDIVSVNGGYVVTAIKGQNADENSWILRLDENGDTLWTYTYGENSPDGAMSVCDNHDGTYAITGYTNSSGNGSTDGYVMLLNDLGAQLYYWPFGTPDYEEPHCIEYTRDGWIISGHAGTTDITTHNVFVQYISSNGTVGDFLTYGAHEHDGAEAMQLYRGTIYIAARSSSRDPLQDPLYLEIDVDGTQLKKEWLGSSLEDPGFGIYVDNYQQLVTGYSRDPQSGRRFLYLLRR